MATDATGTPTSNFSFPTIDPQVDAPSGQGENSIITDVDTKLAASSTLLGAVARSIISKAGTVVGTRRKINLIEGSGISVTVADDSAGEKVDVTIAASGGGVPAGAVTAYAGSTAPSGYLMCDGSAVSRTTYASLFSAISTAYGAGDGSTTFNLPDLQGRVPVGKSGAGGHADVTTLGNSDGVALASRRPKHAHTVTDPGHVHGYSDNGSGVSGNFVSGTQYWEANTASKNTNSATTGISVGQAGVTDAPAYQVVNYIIKT